MRRVFVFATVATISALAEAQSGHRVIPRAGSRDKQPRKWTPVQWAGSGAIHLMK
jgi:hypothetical protein